MHDLVSHSGLLLGSLLLVLVLQQAKELLLPLTAHGSAPANKNKNKMYQIMSYALKTRVYENQRIPLLEIRDQRCPIETWRRKNYRSSSLSPLRRTDYDETFVHFFKKDYYTNL
jgi:hypothetical protein